MRSNSAPCNSAQSFDVLIFRYVRPSVCFFFLDHHFNLRLKAKTSKECDKKMSSSASSSAALAKSQYHHFIPRFILRNFAHSYEPPDNLSNLSAKQRKKRRKNEYHSDESMLHVISLTEATASFIETSISRTFDLTNMYRDFTHATNQHYLEEQLSRLETRASIVISTIRKTFEAEQREMWISRSNRNVLRKFHFIMKYRGSRAHKRFYHHNAKDYSENDREKLLNHMRKKDFERPVDVWFDNITVMLELKINLNLDWIKKLKNRIYSNDAKWFSAHTQMMYLALCTPSDQEEFLLTKNVYVIHERSCSFTMSLNSSKKISGSYIEIHVFAVISLKLIMILRSFLLHILEKDFDEEVKRWRKIMYQINVNMHDQSLKANFMLTDLSVIKARNSYIRLVDGRIFLLDEEDWFHRLYHKFCFHFFLISIEHVIKINCIMLTESYIISKIVFKSKLLIRKTLKYCLSMSCEQIEVYNYKVFSDVSNDPALICLRKLKQAAKLLNSNVIVVYHLKSFEVIKKKNSKS